MSPRLGSILVGSWLVIACGDGAKPPVASPSASTGDSGAPESFGTPHPDDLAELDGGSTGASATTADAGAASASAPVSPPEPKDECTPVGVDFEQRARPKLKECYATGKKKDPNLQGTVKLTVEIDGLGKVKAIKIVEKTLPDSVAQCMLKVLKATPLTEAAKCPGKSLTIPVTFPTPR